MESIGGKAFDGSKKLYEINGVLEAYRFVMHGREDGYLDVLHDMSEKIVGDLTELMKFADSKLSNRPCEIIDGIGDSVWVFAGEREKAGEPLMYILKELAREKLILQINKIFMTNDGGEYPFVNCLSTGPLTKRKLNELLHLLPKEYQDKLRNETVIFSVGGKYYSCLLIG